MKIRMGVIGLGRAAAAMLPALQAHPCIELTAAADPNPQARARFEEVFGRRTFADGASLCQSPEIDGVYIATPHQLHLSGVLAAAENGKHVIVEKPMALTVADCQKMTDAARRAEIVLLVGHTHAFDPPHALMGRLIRSGEYGALRMLVNLVYTSFLYRPRRREELDTGLGGGIMYNQVPIKIDLLRTVAPSPVHTVHAVAGVWDPTRPTEGACAAFITFHDGAVAQLTYSGYDHFDSNELHSWVSDGGEQLAGGKSGAARHALLAADSNAEMRMRTESGFAGRGAISTSVMHEQHFGFLLASCDGADLRPSPGGVLIYDGGGTREIAVPRGRVYPNKDAVADEFYDAVTGRAPIVHDGAWGTATMKIAVGLMTSAAEGRVVTIA